MTTFDEERRDIAEYLKHLSRFSRCRYKGDCRERNEKRGRFDDRL